MLKSKANLSFLFNIFAIQIRHIWKKRKKKLNIQMDVICWNWSCQVIMTPTSEHQEIHPIGLL